MNVLLINTPFLPLFYSDVKKLPIEKQERTSVYPPLGVCYLSSYLRIRGYDVSILDLNLELFRLVKEKGTYNILDVVSLIRRRHADVIGISCPVSTRWKQAHEIAKICKGLGATVVMGGNYPTNSPQKALSDKAVDYVVLGEGEEIFYKLLRSIEEGVGLEDIDGIGYQTTVKSRNRLEFIQDLDQLPFPDYEKLDTETYFSLDMGQGVDTGKRFFTIFTSRGCPNKCVYCASHNVFGYKPRFRSVENVLREVDWLVKEYQANDLLIQDDNFTFDKKRAEDILDGLAERKISWSIPNGIEASTIDNAFLEKAKVSGCSDLTIAVESGSQRVLDLIKKRVDLVRVKELVSRMRELGIYSRVFFMVGFLGETKEDIKKTIDYASELKADWSSFSIVNPLPGTELAEQVGEIDYENIGYANANISTSDFTSEYIGKVVSEANAKINFLENPNLNGGNLDWAIRDFKRIAERYPGHTLARESLGRALEKNLHNR